MLCYAMTKWPAHCPPAERKRARADPGLIDGVGCEGMFERDLLALRHIHVRAFTWLLTTCVHAHTPTHTHSHTHTHMGDSDRNLEMRDMCRGSCGGAKLVRADFVEEQRRRAALRSRVLHGYRVGGSNSMSIDATSKYRRSIPVGRGASLQSAKTDESGSCAASH
jgi:hypothetical protein